MTPLNVADTLCTEFAELITASCGRILIVGSIRRRKPQVNDGDIIYIPRDPNDFRIKLRSLANHGKIEIKMHGPEIQRVKYGSIEIDLYRATTATWGTLQLIRTGSKQFNIRMCQRAQQLGFKLHADGSGIERIAPSPSSLNQSQGEGRGGVIPVNHETEIFTILSTPFVKPEDRD